MTTALQQPSLSSQCMAEFLGTALLIFFGTGCVAALKVAGASFGLWEISIIWGVGVSMAIYLTAGVSGAHLNPAVSIALAIFADFEKRKLPFYILAQIAGAFCGALLVYTLYSNLFFDYEQTHQMVRGSAASLELASVFSTFPNPVLSTAQAFLVEMIITAIPDGRDHVPHRRQQRPAERPTGAAADRFADCRDRQFDGPADRFRDEPGT
jgi:glycerol uptake facilitator protein